MPSASFQPRSNGTHPIGLVVPGNASAGNLQEKSNPERSPSLSARGALGEPLGISVGALVSLLCCKRVLRCLPCVAVTSGVGAHERCECVASTL